VSLASPHEADHTLGGQVAGQHLQVVAVERPERIGKMSCRFAWLLSWAHPILPPEAAADKEHYFNPTPQNPALVSILPPNNIGEYGFFTHFDRMLEPAGKRTGPRKVEISISDIAWAIGGSWEGRPRQVKWYTSL
jgi:hypothetical protein